jgi:diguanylate cyclase (GGDEF)-like protein/putative nucleotidyltransferase with HDIG domain
MLPPGGSRGTGGPADTAADTTARPREAHRASRHGTFEPYLAGWCPPNLTSVAVSALDSQPAAPSAARHRRPRRPARRPTLLLLVYGVCLVLVGVTASAQATVVATSFQAMTLNAVVGDDAGLVRAFVNTFVSSDDLSAGGPAPERLAALEAQLRALVARGDMVRVELRAPDGRVIASDVPDAAGATVPPDAGMAAAADGTAGAAVVQGAEAAGQAGPPLEPVATVREYLPVISRDGTTRAVVAAWRDATPILEQLEATRRDVVLLTLTAAVVLSVILFLVFRGAQARISRQAAQLLEATHLDALTGMPNHGSLVAHLGELLETTRQEGGAVVVGLVDIDNFRQLNDTHGHAAGDRALLVLAGCLQDAAPAAVMAGRYGPDEFLLVASAGNASTVDSTIETIRRELLDWTLTCDESEALPITVSAGICAYPEHAGSVTALLSLAAITLAEAKASGGDAVRHAVAADTGQRVTGFDVLQGLVLAVDTKDRYTKRHSEDVARYALFLADLLGLGGDEKRTLRMAGLLHDVGKIGIPDRVLRKPGRLNAEEQRIIQQHVALGDLIVRDLPNIDRIRAGIRSHHEQWDGRGYLDGLAGEDIPLVARILAVGDAFSAMTTSRPYRKALPLEEAIRRLEDAAGTQLEERLVVLFVEGLRTAPDAPLPGTAAAAVQLWTPGAIAA